ncbi:MAG: acyl carrier protein [Acidobacteria bacterium]|nr:acyl carrier protein [Acidobacteriota bacterium]
MNDLQPRLVRCFQTVFPGLSESQARQATQAALENWDSVAAITLVTVIEEEFSTSVDLEELPELNSFEAIAAYLDGTGV